MKSKKTVIVGLCAIAILAMSSVIAVARNNNSSGPKLSQKSVKAAEEACSKELEVVGQENFNELYGTDSDSKATKRCKTEKVMHAGPGKGPKGAQGPSGQRGPSESRIAATKKKIEAKRLEILKACKDEKDADVSAFNEKYTEEAEKVKAEKLEHLQDARSELEEYGLDTDRIDEQIEKVQSEEAYPFKACVGSQVKDYLDELGVPGPGHGPKGGPGGQGIGPQGPGGPGGFGRP